MISRGGFPFVRHLAAMMVFSMPALAGSVESTPPPPPDILFIILDDQNDMLGCYGDSQAKTPNIDAFAKTGLRFERAYCSSPLCNPSRTALLTGLRSTTTGIYEKDFHFRDAPRLEELVTLPQYLHKYGYADGFEELYDHQTDPHEFTNLLPDPSRKAQLEVLRKPMPEISAPWIDGSRPINSH